jgi:endonuclease YncB( thermonuclease family)
MSEHRRGYVFEAAGQAIGRANAITSISSSFEICNVVTVAQERMQNIRPVAGSGKEQLHFSSPPRYGVTTSNETRIALAVVLSVIAVSAHADVAGPARVIDGDTIVINGEHVRLQGVDAPEADQTCSA